MCNLNKTVVPSVEFVKKLVNNEEYFIKVLQRYGNYIIPSQQKVLRSAAFFESCGIVGSQLSFLLIHQARLFLTRESLLRDYVSRAVNMGFSMNSGFFVYVLRTISGMSIVKVNRKLELSQSCGFSKHETMQMFRRAPVLFSKSAKGLKFGIQVCLHTIMVPKSLLVSNPVILTSSMEKRVIPRWRVMQLLISKNLLEKNPSYVKVLLLQEKKFLEKYVSKFSDDVEALLEAYKGHHLEDAST